MRTVLTGLALVLLLAEASVNAAALKFAGVFSDHMVLQRGRAVPIWGWGDAGEEVAVEFHGQTKSATVDASGRWRVVLEALVADERGTELAVSSRLAGRRAKITDVVVGDVFVLGGQSNVTWWLSTSEGGAEATEAAAYPWLRQFESGFGTADEPMRDVGPGAGWKVCTPGTAGKFSGVGFFFARDLHERIGVPIGLLQTGVAATYGESWISRAAIEGNPALRSILDRYEKALRDLPRKEKEWEAKKAEHAKRVAEAKAAGRPEPEAFKAAPPMSRQNSRRPGALYHGRVAPLMPLAVRSIIWYQGEGDTQIGFAEHYHELLTTLVTTWRAGFGDPLLPVFIVQLPPLCYDDPWHSSPLVREAQLRVSREQSNCGLVTLLDEVEHKDIHPKNKRVVGER
ncbi:MAG: sialate O-acetylesterase, partial [Verrucomicrobiota bacterium]